MKIKLVILLSLLFFSCYKADISEDQVLNRGVWSEYINIHDFGFGLQDSYFRKLVETGAVIGIRIGKLDSSSTSNWLYGGRVEVLGIFDNEYLRESNVCEVFENYTRRHPYIKYWEIGNEVEYFINMQPEEYMPIFEKIYQTSKKLNVTVLSQAPFGNIDGAKIFERMVKLGLDKYPDIIVALHFYGYASEAIHKFAAQVHKLPFSTKVWVTEAGINQFSKHIGFVNQVYHDIQSSLRAERIYWYDFSECSEHALVSNLAPACAGAGIGISPLFSALIGEEMMDNSNSSSIFGIRRRE